MNGKYQVGSGRVVAFTHDTPFTNGIISQDSGKVNSELSRKSKDLAESESEGVETDARAEYARQLREWKLKSWSENQKTTPTNRGGLTVIFIFYLIIHLLGETP